jgi:dimethylamine/trimethylamine dehydrogenase
MSNVQIYLDSALEADDVLQYGANRIVLATGSQWRTDGMGPATPNGLPGLEMLAVMSPEAVVHALRDNSLPRDVPVTVYDDDHYYVGHSVAELLRAKGYEVTLVTPLADVSQWSYYTLELRRLDERLAKAGIRCLTKTRVLGGQDRALRLSVNGREELVACGLFVPVTLRVPDSRLMASLESARDRWTDSGIVSVDAIGDAVAPGTVAAAVYAGAQYARDLGVPGAPSFLRERVVL